MRCNKQHKSAKLELRADAEEWWRDNEVATALFDECKQLLEGLNAQPKPAQKDEEGE